MDQKSLSNWIKVILIGVAIGGLIGLTLIIPSLGQDMVAENPEMKNRYIPWLCFAWAVGIPCFTALVFGWKIATNIGKDRSFSYDNARYLKLIAYLAAGDSAFFFLMNIVMIFAGMSHPGVLLASLIITFIGVAIAVAAAALSHLVRKAAALQEESDLTI